MISKLAGLQLEGVSVWPVCLVLPVRLVGLVYKMRERVWAGRARNGNPVFLCFGVFGVFIVENNVDVKSSIGLIIGSIGSIIVILALYKPLSLIAPILLNRNQDQKTNKNAISIWFTVIGFSLLIGGVAFSFTGRVEFLLLSLLVPSLLAFFLKSVGRNKKN